MVQRREGRPVPRQRDGQPVAGKRIPNEGGCDDRIIRSELENDGDRPLGGCDHIFRAAGAKPAHEWQGMGTGGLFGAPICLWPDGERQQCEQRAEP